MRKVVRCTMLLAGLVLVASEARTSEILPPLDNLLIRAKVERVETSGEVPIETGVVWTLDHRALPGIPKHKAACDMLILATPVKTLSKTSRDWQIVQGSVWVLVPNALARVGSEFEVYVSQSQETNLTGGGKGEGPLMIHGGRRHMTTYFKRISPTIPSKRSPHVPS